MGACPPLRQSDSRAPSGAPIAPLPRKRLAFSTTGGASALSPSRTAEGSQPFGNSMGVQELLTTWCASCSAQPLLPIWYENSHEFCPKPHRRAAAAARSRSNRKPHPAWQAALCTARAASSPQGQTMAGQGRSPCVLLGSRRGGSLSQREPPLRKAPRVARLPLLRRAALGANFQKILPLLHKSGRQTPPCAPFSEALRKKRSRKGEPCRKTKRAPPRAAHP